MKQKLEKLVEKIPLISAYHISDNLQLEMSQDNGGVKNLELADYYELTDKNQICLNSWYGLRHLRPVHVVYSGKFSVVTLDAVIEFYIVKDSNALV